MKTIKFDNKINNKYIYFQDGTTIEKGGVNTTLLTIPFSKGLA